jgi:hypothetical protein
MRGMDDGPWTVLGALGLLLLAAPDAVPALAIPGDDSMRHMMQMGS